MVYSADQVSSHWVYQQFDDRGYICLNRTFHLSEMHLVAPRPKQLDAADEFGEIEFVIAKTVGEYFQLDSEILKLENNLFLYNEVPLNRKTFIAERNISIFAKMDALSSEDIYIGGKEDVAVPVTEFDAIVKNFPNTYELNRYAQARVGAVLTNYVELRENSQQKFIDYMNRKTSKVGVDLLHQFADVEVFRYSKILNKLKTMLSDENSYSEKQWQSEILQIILLLYPKYIHAFKEAPVRDSYNLKNRSIDFLLVDANGNTDIIEIKKPFDQCIITKGKYRDNHIPLRELSGTVMQVEKYLFHLSKWGIAGEKALTDRYKSKLTPGITIKVTNPSGIIIMGRDEALSSEQKQDFEVIKRKYKNVVDIITYDDLLSRLEVMLSHWKTYV